ncbi:TPA: hypothetical protein QEL15_004115 [Stenotrophomonas maltophilia]|nr:hypothetical protein [Stenotrophomonas maltophilia]
MSTDNKTLAVDVLAVMDELIDFEERHAEYEPRQNQEAREARAALAELIDADQEFDSAGESLEFIQNSTSPRSYTMLNAAIERYEYSRIRRSDALARVKGESA